VKPAPALLAAGVLALGGLAASSGPVPLFREVAAQSGLRFHHFTGATGQYFMPEIMGAGGALFDYDGDGLLDVYLVQGALLEPGTTAGDALFPLPKGQPPGDRLFRNVSRRGPSGRLELRFTDVTEAAGLGQVGHGMGVAVGDYDNDGRPDLYVTRFGSNSLYHNNGDGTFSDVTRAAGVDDPRWSTSASWCDYDRDGRLDLFVANYIDFTVAGNKACFDPLGARDYCSPSRYHPVPARLFHNEGGGRFTDRSEAAGITRAFGPGLGVVCADLDGDGWPDFYVANDGAANQLWINRRDGTFEDRGLLSGTAFNGEGLPEGSMGIAVGDFDDDGDEDLLVTNLPRETNTLYVNLGHGHFEDATETWGLAQPSIPFTGFGAGWLDYDNDGRLDLFVANGGVSIVEALRGQAFPYRQHNQLFHNPGRPPMREVTDEAGEAFHFSEVGRGAAFGDVDNDGFVDVLVTNNNGPARLLLNQGLSRHHWLEVRLEGVSDNADGIGARVGIARKGRAPLWRRAHTDGSYLSASDVRVHFGLAEAAGPVEVLVEWPRGAREAWTGVAVDRLVTLRQGTGRPWPAGAGGPTEGPRRADLNP
jgi:enediyne biosynthesis protein E4